MRRPIVGVFITIAALVGACTSNARPPVNGCKEIRITTASLQDGTEGLIYFDSISTTGGVPPLSWTALGILPPGLVLDPVDGSVSGTPAMLSVGTYNVDVMVTDSCSPTPSSDTRTLSIRIRCAEDLYEDNDAPAAAYSFLDQDGVFLSSLDGWAMAQNGDDDWFLINPVGVGNPPVWSLDIMFAHSSGNIDAELYNSTMILIASGNSSSDNEQLTGIGISTDHFVRVFMVDSTTCNDYDLTYD